MNAVMNPDILIPYDRQKTINSPCIVPLYVRPETNRVDYESLIIQSISDIGSPVFMANYNGEVIRHRQIIRNHYFYRYIFALHGKSEMQKYPEFIDSFEKKYNTTYKEAEIFGAYQFLNNPDLAQGMDADTLFHHYVPESEYLFFKGISIKKINEVFVINYDIPAIMNKYNSQTNILVLMISLKEPINFRDVNYAIYSRFKEKDISKLLNIEHSEHLSWDEQVKRTYHISHNHIEAMFDMTDFILYKDYSCLKYIDTPLGRALVDNSIISEGEIDNILNYFKKFPIMYAKENGQFKKLINLREVASHNDKNGICELDFDSCVDLFRSVIV